MTKRDGLHLLGEIRKGAAIAWDDTEALPDPIVANLHALFAQSRIQSKVARDEPIRILPEPFAGPFTPEEYALMVWEGLKGSPSPGTGAIDMRPSHFTSKDERGRASTDDALANAPKGSAKSEEFRLMVLEETKAALLRRADSLAWCFNRLGGNA